MANIIRIGGGTGGVTLEDFIDNVISNNARLASYTTYESVRYKIDDNNYSIFSFLKSGSTYRIRVSFLPTYCTRGKLGIFPEFVSNGGMRLNNTNTVATDGRTNFYPIELSEYQYSWSNVYWEDYSYDVTNLPFYSKKTKFVGLQQANTHPAIYNCFGDSKYHLFSDFINNSKIKDFVDFTLYYPVSDLKCVFLCQSIGDGWSNIYWISLPKTSQYYYDTDAGQFIFGNSSGSHTNDYIRYDTSTGTSKLNLSLTTSDNGLWHCTLTTQELAAKIPFNTMDIKDQNGNVVLAANCTLADLGIS